MAIYRDFYPVLEKLDSMIYHFSIGPGCGQVRKGIKSDITKAKRLKG